MSPRKLGAQDSTQRIRLLDAAEQLMIDEGYPAVTTRRVAAKAELHPQLVHYYFRSIDQLLLDVFRRRAEMGLEFYAQLLEQDLSLQTLWSFGLSEPVAKFNIEFVGLANHNTAIASEIRHYSQRYLEMQLAAVARILEERGITREDCPPNVALLAMTGISQIMMLSESVGLDVGRDEAIRFIERFLKRQDDRPVLASEVSDNST
ncbi:TetR/AcrR family transcriptional regulator [Mycolicibacterium sp. 050232]|uniref:TetR/AcrR family transcriptional regulator n=1 Tax=Mycolicibacterium sp. 050232 TaxID=3113982 RepID=UPI002E297543|nr:TetR/AcrR family transcriptional regulator [Mycolicibacterium sp. 050232]MED5813647.1 TetR/AcrR family transcriptional regulator [Mycolicibacterium sp. 050232]